MIVWTVANQKGGVGKTTTAVALAGLLAEQGKRVLCIDTDPHASLTYYFGIDSEELESSAFDVFSAGKNITAELMRRSILPTEFNNLSVMPATMALATLDRKLGTQDGMGLVLKRGLAMIADDFDYVLIDVPPVLGVLMVNALACCRRVLIPVQTEFLALKGLDRMMRTLTLIHKSRGENYAYTIIPTLYDKRTNASLQTYKKLIARYGRSVWNGMIPIDTKFRDASNEQQPPSVYAPKARGVLAYQSLLTNLQQLDVR
ncbi:MULTISPECIES: ParA family protein [Idiomarina]|jgi:chromosome partitioning protein|uniref:ParA family protein n=2 Tax=Idiomarinaceae TaxID=267893 RepID=UPI0006C8A1C1|nr:MULTISPECIES: ParA family protein [Idiomarina]RDX35100.1 ParA family protein [Idiomarina sp. HD9-110m-PIT-SAG05]KPD22157.1 cobalamin biosynthesis protein CobQ [Idiomarina abyssalis]MAB22367.1 ParA family protein [Idiomarina sp.]MAO67513.1 ParA family protein [Idiomarina sp.]MBF80304.1 ParA family protein [Idiomarina sp.]|tara:strand:+ start:1471 stop:2247 length:777 start_codon:yes stop_codon:yes gene_type:complete